MDAWCECEYSRLAQTQRIAAFVERSRKEYATTTTTAARGEVVGSAEVLQRENNPNPPPRPPRGSYSATTSTSAAVPLAGEAGFVNQTPATSTATCCAAAGGKQDGSKVVGDVDPALPEAAGLPRFTRARIWLDVYLWLTEKLPITAAGGASTTEEQKRTEKCERVLRYLLHGFEVSLAEEMKARSTSLIRTGDQEVTGREQNIITSCESKSSLSTGAAGSSCAPCLVTSPQKLSTTRRAKSEEETHHGSSEKMLLRVVEKEQELSLEEQVHALQPNLRELAEEIKLNHRHCSALGKAASEDVSAALKLLQKYNNGRIDTISSATASVVSTGNVILPAASAVYSDTEFIVERKDESARCQPVGAATSTMATTINQHVGYALCAWFNLLLSQLRGGPHLNWASAALLEQEDGEKEESAQSRFLKKMRRSTVTSMQQMMTAIRKKTGKNKTAAALVVHEPPSDSHGQKITGNIVSAREDVSENDAEKEADSNIKQLELQAETSVSLQERPKSTTLEGQNEINVGAPSTTTCLTSLVTPKSLTTARPQQSRTVSTTDEHQHMVSTSTSSTDEQKFDFRRLNDLGVLSSMADMLACRFDAALAESFRDFAKRFRLLAAEAATTCLTPLLTSPPCLRLRKNLWKEASSGPCTSISSCFAKLFLWAHDFLLRSQAQMASPTSFHSLLDATARLLLIRPSLRGLLVHAPLRRLERQFLGVKPEERDLSVAQLLLQQETLLQRVFFNNFQLQYPKSSTSSGTRVVVVAPPLGGDNDKEAFSQKSSTSFAASQMTFAKGGSTSSCKNYQLRPLELVRRVLQEEETADVGLVYVDLRNEFPAFTLKAMQRLLSWRDRDTRPQRQELAREIHLLEKALLLERRNTKKDGGRGEGSSTSAENYPPNDTACASAWNHDVAAPGQEQDDIFFGLLQ
ncbi:unnamed protein product [Amoebophrya sp. A120]|nr:unnamed protein product [Amoebophrya sp. A120]|eukprot:GSA120T00001606001.1